MKKFLLMTVIPLALAGCAAPGGGEEHAHAGYGGPARNAGMHMGMMQDNMLTMHEQMHSIMEAKDPAERARLMKEHRESMQQHVRMMRGADPGGMGGPTMGAPAGK